MRIAFLGKGGSGKTTMAAGFIKYAAQRCPLVLAVDADVNVHLQSALQIEGSAKKLGESFDIVSAYLRGNRLDLGELPMIGTTPPSLKSNFIRVCAKDLFLREYALSKQNIALLTVGTYVESDVETGACFHTKLYSLEAIFHHLLDTPDEVVVSDTTAGVDNIATSLSFVYDLNIFVVEPTVKSMTVYRDFCSIAQHLQDRTYVVGNKIDSVEDEDFINKSVNISHYLGSIASSKHLKRFEQGDADALIAFEEEQTEVFKSIYDLLQKQRRDWQVYLARLKQSHMRVCRSYMNNQFGIKIEDAFDPDFAYEKVIKTFGLGHSRESTLVGTS